MALWTALMAVMVMALALVMRREILAALDGNWLPMAHFLLLVQAVATFDIRTRGGLYAGMALSGIVLFFAGQQAFGLSFGIFLLGYAALLMAFLATAFLEDESIGAKRPSARAGKPLGFWSATAVGVLALSVGAFLLLPRGEGNAAAYQQVAALPIAGELGATDALLADSQLLAGEDLISADEDSLSPEAIPDEVLRLAKDSSLFFTEGQGQASGPGQPFMVGAGGFPWPETGPAAEGMVMHVRSPLASYWRGQVFDNFDGVSWHLEDILATEGLSARRVPRDLIRYTQTYFIHQEQPLGTTFMGYRGVEVRSSENAEYRRSLGKSFSYSVLSVQPDLLLGSLRRDSPGVVDPGYYEVPPSLGWLTPMANWITDGADTDLDKMVGIVSHLRQRGRYDASAADQLGSSASLSDFLLEGVPGTSADFATATVMLARAAGLPARLATGYLPGERDPLSGAYAVRSEDAHAWAEVRFRRHGWVPFDGTHHPDRYAAGQAPGGHVPGLKHFFESSVGDDVLRAAVLAPARLGGLRDALGSPAITALSAMAIGALLVAMAWLGLRLLRGRRRRDKGWAYHRLQGSGRDEMLRVYRQVERLLRRRGVEPRRPGQTMREYAGSAAERLEGLEPQLTWFTEAAWAAAYDPASFPIEAVQEGKARLTDLRAAVG